LKGNWFSTLNVILENTNSAWLRRIVLHSLAVALALATCVLFFYTLAQLAQRLAGIFVLPYFLGHIGLQIALTVLCGYLFLRLSRALPDLDKAVRWAAIIHALVILSSWFATNHLHFLLGFRTWTIMAVTWLTWPTLVILRQMWSMRSGFYVLIGFLLVLPCVSRAASFAFYAFGYWQMPTAGRPTIEVCENLGYGFSVIALGQYTPSKRFDSVVHTNYLFFRGMKLAPATSSAVSPNGCMVAYQNPWTRQICIFSKPRNATTTLMQKAPGSVVLFAFDMPAKTVSALISDDSNRDSRPQRVKFPLPKGE
jgi:hypothetical protein